MSNGTMLFIGFILGFFFCDAILSMFFLTQILKTLDDIKDMLDEIE